MDRANADRAPDTIATHAGRDPPGHSGTVNPPVYHASTILFERLADYENRQELFYEGVGYGLYNTPTTLALVEAVAALEGATHTVLVPSGTAAPRRFSCVRSTSASISPCRPARNI